MTDSLFAHLALTFGSHPENLATEALGYILRTSPGARAGVADFLREAGCSVPDELRWVNQVGGQDGGRPDLVGLDGAGKQVLLVEAKFWAGLTDKQPLVYLDRLPPGGALLVVGPAARSTLLWAELRKRLVEDGRALEERPISSHGVNAGTVGGKLMVLVSWRALLAAARIRAEGDGEVAIAADIAQLQGLCDRMDSQAFIPVTGEELSDHRYRRVVEFCDIVDTVTDLLVKGDLASIRGFKATSGKGHYMRYMLLNGVVGASLLCDVRKWMKFGSTPLWLTIHGPTPTWKPTSEVEHLLAPLALELPRRLFTTGDHFPTVPIFVPVGAEKHVVEQKAFEQVADVAKLLVGLAAPAAAETADPSVADLEASDQMA